MTLTSKFRGQMINCLFLKNAWSHLQEKSCVNRLVVVSYMTLATDLACDLDHEFPRSNLEIAISTKYLTWLRKNNIKEGEFFGWFATLLMISGDQFTKKVNSFSKWANFSNFITFSKLAHLFGELNVFH